METGAREDGRVLYRNAACLVINKRAGEDSQGGGAYPRAVHRLDVPVTGCLLLARNAEALAFLSAAFRGSNPGGKEDAPEGGIRKIYWAITETGEGAEALGGAGRLVHYLSRDPKRNRSTAWDEAGKGRRIGVLHYRLAGRGERYLFWEIDLITGRHHQIRAQFARAGLPIKGDLKYGARRSEKTGGIRLHARSLSFPNPLAPGETLTALAPPPEDNLWRAFEAACLSEAPEDPREY
ncbi:MAG: RNA pseudouridine synthase [Treponema sp.]|jgi:23S rRNA pseudouridine1911/1915/1917 synthase|nr:RNA pseudouridine synthase [Treponema sp.]